MTLNGVMALNLRYSTVFVSFRGRVITSKCLKIDLYCQRCSPKNSF